MRLVCLLPTLSCLALVACSGAASTDLFDDTPSSSSRDPEDPSPQGGLTSSGGSGSATAPSNPGSATAPPPPPAPDGRPGDDDKDAPAVCAREAEPNDALAQATRFQGCLSGKISARQDVDFAVTVVPAGATRMSFGADSPDGLVSVRATINGLPAFPQGGDMPVTPGQKIGFEIRLGGGDTSARPAYNLTVSFP